MKRSKTMAEKKAMEPTVYLVDSFREINQTVIESIVGVQERNLKLAQSMLTSAMEVMQSNIEATGKLMQDLEHLTKKQQEAFQELVPGWMGSQWMEPYLSFLRTPFSSYQEALGVMEKTTREGFKTVEEVIEDVGKAAREPVLAGKERIKK
jgi:mevalonate kinase